jgi:Protein of unknown function (DUF2586)
MALPNINFNRSASGLGRALPGTDYVSGMIHYYASGAGLPSGFRDTDNIKKIFSVADAENLGITDTHLGETKAIAKVAVGGTPARGDIMIINYTGINEAVSLVPAEVSRYTLTSADAVSTTTAAAAIAANINANTQTHGFTATSATSNVLISTKGGEGIFPNSGTPYVAVATGTTTLTVTNPTGSGSTVLGIASWIDTLHYHISEYFRIQPKGELYVGIYPEESTTYAFADITTMQNYAQGSIKQLSVFEKNVAFSAVQCAALQAICDANEAVYKPLEIILNAEISATASVATLVDLSTQTAPNVSVCIAQDGANDGYHIYKATGKTVGAIGAMLGSISLASVQESIGWVAKFNMALGSELDTIAFSNGQMYSALAESQFESLNSYSYTFLRKLTDISGSYWSNSLTTTSPTSDYSTIENNRVYHKITRVVRKNMLPALSGNIYVQADGTLTSASIGYYETLANNPLVQMQADGEISAHKVIINPNQNVLATSTLELTLQNVPVGVARIIKINVGFVKSV